MQLEVLPDAERAARRAAAWLASRARSAVAARDRFLLAVSGGTTPWAMLRAFAAADLPWAHVHVLQVDERVAPAGSPERNLTHLEACLEDAPLPRGNLHAMPVEEADLGAAARRYAQTLEALGGAPPVLDVVHLGLGRDGHTASLVPGDPALEVADADVALAGPYQGRVRMTLTVPVLCRARAVLWLVAGGDKRDVLARLRAGDVSIPAGRIRRGAALVIADRAAAGDARPAL